MASSYIQMIIKFIDDFEQLRQVLLSAAEHNQNLQDRNEIMYFTLTERVNI